MHVRDQKIFRIANFEWHSKAALAALFFCLQREDLPVGNIIEDRFIANVMFAGELVDAASGRGMRHIQAGLSEGAGRPDIYECSATAIGDPQAWVLAIPATI